MDQGHRSFRTIDPSEGAEPVVGVCWSCSGDKVVLATSGSRIRVYDRNGNALMKTVCALR